MGAGEGSRTLAVIPAQITIGFLHRLVPVYQACRREARWKCRGVDP